MADFPLVVNPSHFASQTKLKIAADFAASRCGRASRAVSGTVLARPCLDLTKRVNRTHGRRISQTKINVRLERPDGPPTSATLVVRSSCDLLCRFGSGVRPAVE